MRGFEAVCADCEFDQVAPTREVAEHAARVHERETDHRVTVEEFED